MIISNAKVYTEKDGFQERDVFITDGKFCEAHECEDDTIIDAHGAYLIPGLIDIHFHGCMGYDFCDASKEALEQMAMYQASVGVTSMVPATMTCEEEQLLEIVKVASEYENKKGASLCGIFMEGPFISHEKKGAQRGNAICLPDVDMYHKVQKAANGLVKLVAIAPEAEGALDFIDQTKDQVILTMAHTNANYETAKVAFEQGVSHVTHLYNAMNPIHHRSPGPVIAAAEQENCHVELICDGIHVHPAMVRATLQLFGADRVVFVSDSMRATGLADGVYELGGQRVTVKENRATLEDKTIAGACTNLMEDLRAAVKHMQVPLEVAVKCATENPARVLGAYDQMGSIAPGKIANAVLLRMDDLSVMQVILKGELYDRTK